MHAYTELWNSIMHLVYVVYFNRISLLLGLFLLIRSHGNKTQAGLIVNRVHHFDNRCNGEYTLHRV